MRRILPLVLAALCGTASIASAQDSPVSVVLAPGGSYVYQHGRALTRVSVADPKVVEAIVTSPKEVVLNAKGVGSSGIVLWDDTGAHTVLTVDIMPDADALRAAIAEVLPNEKGIAVKSVGRSYVLSGTVSSAAAKKALDIANSTGTTVVDAFDVRAASQILLQVRFAEISRTAGRDLSVQLLRQGTEGMAASGAERFNGKAKDDDPNRFGGTFSDAVNLFLFSRDIDVTALIKALSTNGQYRSLAEPNLVAIDGKDASFLAGGEFPFPAGGGVSGTSIQFKEYGIRLAFTPTLLANGDIRLKVAPEASSLDFANGVTSNGFQIPSVLTRRALTEVDLKDGQSFAIAGLLDQSMTTSMQKIPFIGSVPILGTFFKSKSVRERKNELLLIVTARLIPAGSANATNLPTLEVDKWGWKMLKQPLPAHVVPKQPRNQPSPKAPAQK